MSASDITSFKYLSGLLFFIGLWLISAVSTSASPVSNRTTIHADMLLAQSAAGDTEGEESEAESGEGDDGAEDASSENNDATGDESKPDDDATLKTEAQPDNGPALPEVLTNLEDIPFPVRKMRELILEAARSGDIEKLRRYIGYGDDVTMLSLGGHDQDPITFLKELSGDPEGHEILAIITEILEAPFVKIEQVPGEEIYVWPYFYAYPFDKLTPEQRVQLFRIITYGDFEEMASFGSYIFYRLGITPEGRWRFLVAGD